GEPLVDLAVPVPPHPVVVGRGDDVVAQGPQGVVGEPLVVLLDVRLAQGDGHQPDAVLVDGGGRFLALGGGRPGPSDPGAALVPDHRVQGGDQTAGGAAPDVAAVLRHRQVEGQAVRDDDERAVGGGHTHGHGSL